MRIVIQLVCIALIIGLTIACASKRERRQSMYASEQIATHRQRDTTWQQQQWDEYRVQVVETYTFPLGSNTLSHGAYTLGTGRYTVGTGGFTRPMGSNYQ